jgi:lipid-binding SYLF domain-containing protein
MRMSTGTPARHRSPARTSPVGSALAALLTILLCGCATLSPDEREAKKIELDAMAGNTLETLFATTPQARDAIDRSLGYMVMDIKVTKVPVFGAGRGYAIVVDRRNDSRSYLEVTRFDIGGGLGAQAFKVIVVFMDAGPLEKAAGGAWHYEAGAELAAGASSSERPAEERSKGYQVYRIAESGAAATVTVRIARAKPF